MADVDAVVLPDMVYQPKQRLMKVAHFSTSESLGGAAQATYKLHRGLLKQGVQSKMYVRYPSDVRPVEVYSLQQKGGIWENKIKPRIRNRAYLGYHNQYHPASYTPFSWNKFLPEYTLEEPFIQEADIIGLYWIGEFLNPENLVFPGKPVVWRLSDIWPFSGGCHYPGTCRGYQSGCGSCPQLNSQNPKDFSHEQVQRKWEVYQNLNLTIAAPTKWIGHLASESRLFQGRPVEVIQTGVDETHFKPLEKGVIRDAFSIPRNSRLILFGADSAADPRKGIRYLLEALEKIKKQTSEPLLLGIFGRNYDPEFDRLGIPIRYFGYITELYLPMLYNAADVFVAPSLEENLPNTALEAMACGIPVAGFQTGGMPELVGTGHNGYLARLQDSDDLSTGIHECLINQEKWGNEARSTILNHFTQSAQTAAYLQLYKRLTK